MNKKNFVMGISALALIFAISLTSCASVDQQTLKKAGVPNDQRATLYWVFTDYRLEKIDGVKYGDFFTFYGLLGGKPGTIKDKSITKGVPLNRWAQVSAGEHTIIISDEWLIGRKSYEGTFNFEAGKKYLVQLVVPSQYKQMMESTFSGLMGNAANSMKEDLAGDMIIIIAESKKDYPIYPDDSIKQNQWVKSIK
ncbi:MAG: hypothetical protein LBV17_11525 [Treponema sp.]|jgi:hypothetical protein|nr:hypothetical protein [Treponema sp.]